MKRKGITSAEDAVRGKVQHTQPCHDCPMRRNAIPGWLGGSTPAEYRSLCHSDAQVNCHAIRGQQCAGVAIYRSNVVKRVDPPLLKLPADRTAVFATPMEFEDWHSNISASFAKLSVTK